MKARTLAVDSPFNLARQALVYLPDTAAPTGYGPDFHALYAAAIAPHVDEVLALTGGRALCLYSSWAVLDETAARVRWRPLRTQRDGSRQELVAWFKRTLGAVLFGVASFWEGVDVPGEALSCVMVDRIPFPSPQDPLEQARRERLGRGAYFEHARATALVKLRQGAGRLIRTVADRGLVVLFDPRLRGQHAAMLAALAPGGTLDARSLAAVPRFLANAGGGG